MEVFRGQHSEDAQFGPSSGQQTLHQHSHTRVKGDVSCDFLGKRCVPPPFRHEIVCLFEEGLLHIPCRCRCRCRRRRLAGQRRLVVQAQRS